MPDGTATINHFKPKLITVLRDGYGRDDFRHDLISGLTVAIVALPLSMAIAVGSGVSPDRGLFTAIVGGFIVSALSGSRFQIGGPAGAFIVLVAATLHKYGIDGLLLAVAVSGLMLTLAGIFRIGALIRYIPHAVTIGFTAGIAATICASQLKDFAGLQLIGTEPGALFPKLAALAHALPTLSVAALGVGLGTVLLIFGVRAWRPQWPGMLIALVLTSGLAWQMQLPVATIGSRFGSIPHTLPMPVFPVFNTPLFWLILPSALSFTLLGGVESLLSAKVADGMTGRRHRSNMELVAQGLANVGSAFFGGISVTGTIARTATNIRAGGRSPIAGMLHAVFLLLFMLIAAPLARYVPLATLAGVLMTVAWNMIEKSEVVGLLRDWRGAAVLLTTFGLTMMRDLTVGILVGCTLAVVIGVVAPRGGGDESR